MVSLKKAALAVLALGVTGVASAAMYVPPPATGCTVGNNVTVPCEKKGWSFAADALVVQTNNIGAVSENVGVVTSDVAPFVTTNETENSFNPDWNWGFQFAAAYYFGTGNDINLNWTHFAHGSDQTDVSTATSDVFGNYISNTFFDDDAVGQVSTNVDNNFNAINLEFGQLVNFGDHVQTRFHGGIQWAQVDLDLTQTGTTGVAGSLDADQSSIDSDFDGIGPRFGMDTSYNFGNGLSVFGNLAAGILVGSINTTASETITNDDGVVTGISNVSTDSGSSVVPEAEVKIGVRYTYAMAQGDLSAEAGWEAVNYWDAQNVTNFNTDDSSNVSNFGYDGIFFGLKWMGNA